MQFSQMSFDYTDVTLAADDVQICKHFQTGHCKFGGSCQKRHVPENCSKAHCLDKTCFKRHPKQCRFFSQAGFCKFGDFCSYKHTTSPSFGHFHLQIQALEVRIKGMCRAIYVLEQEILELKNVNKCKICDRASDRATSSDDTLNLSVPGVERTELSTSSCYLLSVVEESPTMCEWCYCTFKTSSTSDMMKHAIAAHTITTDLVFPESCVKIDCPEGEEICDKDFFLDQTFAMHVYNVHKVGFRCDHCHTFIPGGDGLQEIHMKLCTFPCSALWRKPLRNLELRILPK